MDVLQSFRFLDLPRELRDMVYEHYVHIDGGYIFNYRLSKFQGAKRQSINLSLMLTCKLVAAEMCGVALRENTITFTTACSEDFRIRAGRYSCILDDLWNTQAYMLAIAGAKITSNVTAHVARHYPMYSPIVERLGKRVTLETPQDRYIELTSNTMGEAVSTHRSFLGSTLQLLGNEIDLAALRREESLREAVNYADQVAKRKFEQSQPGLLPFDLVPWEIPEESKLDGIRSSPNWLTWEKSHDNRFWNAFEYSISAAAVATAYLGSMPAKRRTQIRDIILHEDKLAVARPECHALGLIEFCVENPRLRVERYVNLWRSAFPLVSDFRSVRRERKRDGLRPKDVTEAVSLWISEAHALVPSGMPPKAFSLILDGDQIPERTAQIFEEVVQRDATWEAALAKGMELKYGPETNAIQRWHRLEDLDDSEYDRNAPRYRYKHLSRALCDVSTSTDIVRCSFYVTPLWEMNQNMNRILRENHELPLFVPARTPTSFIHGASAATSASAGAQIFARVSPLWTLWMTGGLCSRKGKVPQEKLESWGLWGYHICI
ncbi:hypothetical protein P154DRAFT_528316 [Amniculicola lignicola CBS 123094]|uniref:Uncharacterized protein n=1 Tax=Amniculicola lignicola CBS 123094 TaxID=1392246 RepID=A0A6A5VVE8_9PLEO|nr:hypothetical protein P154DRAFT_528316 [Amniculicola lignicola CBS 123094]